MEAKEKMVCKYVDKYGIFTDQVDVKVLHDTILHDFMPCLTQSNFWFAVWCVLKDSNCLKIEVKRSDFGRQMNYWFGKAYRKNCLDAYAATILSCTQWTNWDDAFFKTFEDRYEKAIEKGRLSVGTAKNMYYLCSQFNSIIEKKKCIKENIQS